MSVDRWNTVLVLGGIRSGKSAFAESLVADSPSVRYVATAAIGEGDPEWLARIEAHQRRRPQSWTTEETGSDPARLAAVLSEAKPDDTLLVDDIGGWVRTLLDPANQPQDDLAVVAALAAAVRGCPARVVLVSPEVGLSLVPVTPVGRAFADAVGTTNQALAEVCDRVALIVAGRPAWIKDSPGTPEEGPIEAALTVEADAPALVSAAPVSAAPVSAAPVSAAPVSAAPVSAAPDGEAALAESQVTPAAVEAEPEPEPEPVSVFVAPTVALPVIQPRGDQPEPAHEAPVIEAGMDLPMPDADAGPDATDRLATLDLAGAGIGPLREAVEFAAATQSTVRPRPWTAVRVVLFSGVHAGGAAAGDDPAEAERRIAQIEAGQGVLARLAVEAGADVEVVRVPESGAMENGPVLAAEVVDTLLREGWQLAEAAADDGRDALVIGSAGVGVDAVATAVSAATTGAEPVAVLPRVLQPGGRIDDEAWMVRCAAVRDALHRIRQEPRGARDILTQLGGADIAVAAGVLLGAASRRLPVLLDGPLGIAAGLIARDYGAQTRHWCLLPDAGTSPLVGKGADVLGLTPVLTLGLDLGEGSNALAALPLLRTAIALAASLPVHPGLPPTTGD